MLTGWLRFHRGAQLDPFVATSVTAGWLEKISTDDAAHLAGGLSVQRFSMRLAVRDVTGFVLGGLYLAFGRNLWPAILAHGMSDTLALIMVYCGFTPGVKI